MMASLCRYFNNTLFTLKRVNCIRHGIGMCNFSYLMPLFDVRNIKVHNNPQRVNSCVSNVFCRFKHDEVDDETEDTTLQYEDMVQRVFHFPEMGHQVLVIQPYIKWGASKKRSTTPDLQLSEAVSLINTLKKWKVVDKMKISLTTFDRRTLFGSGNLERLQGIIQSNVEITAVFISVDMLQAYKHEHLEEKFGVPVYDRYMIVIQIFREHAISREAKLQVAMAEIPYLKKKMKGLSESILSGGGTHLEIRRRVLYNHETKLRNMLEKVQQQRTMLRSKWKKMEYPLVAVVGYTNAGKTSLIKALTGDKDMEPKDHLFATLDVTVHAGLLPSYLKVLYIDTVGFISDIPTNLMEAFLATLEDAMFADVVVHVCDLSHPDFIAQSETVTRTLKQLNVNSSLTDNILVVGNKMDLLSEQTQGHQVGCTALVSAVTGQGLNDLAEHIEKLVLRATDRVFVKMRVRSGGEEMSWLYRNATVSEVMEDERSSQHLVMRVVITKAQLHKFQHTFIRKS